MKTKCKFYANECHNKLERLQLHYVLHKARRRRRRRLESAKREKRRDASATLKFSFGRRPLASHLSRRISPLRRSAVGIRLAAFPAEKSSFYSTPLASMRSALIVRPRLPPEEEQLISFFTTRPSVKQRARRGVHHVCNSEASPYGVLGEKRQGPPRAIFKIHSCMKEGREWTRRRWRRRTTAMSPSTCTRWASRS